MNETKKEIIRSVIAWILAAFLSVMLAVGALFSVFGSVFCRQEVLIAAARETGYTEKMIVEVAEQYRSIALTSNIPEELTDAFVKEHLTEEIAIYPIAHLSDRTSLDLSAYQEALLAEVRAYAAELEEAGELVFDNEKEREELDQSLISLCEIYTSDLRSAIQMRGVFTVLENVGTLYAKLKTPVLAGLAVFAALAIALLAAICKKRSFYCFYGGVGATGILCAGVFGVLWLVDPFQNLSLTTLYLKDWLQALMQSAFSRLSFVGFGFLAAALVLGLVGFLWCKKEKEHDHQSIPRQNA